MPIEGLPNTATQTKTIPPRSSWGEEKDPYGLDQKEPGAKLDAGKIQLSLLKDFKYALLAIGVLTTKGKDKYSAHGWQHAEGGVERYEDAMIGHWLREGIEDFDPGMKLPHQILRAWNDLASLELWLREQPDLIKKLSERRMI